MYSKYPYWDVYLSKYGGYYGNLHRKDEINELEIKNFKNKVLNCFDSSKSRYESCEIFLLITILPKEVRKELVELVSNGDMDLNKYFQVLETVGKVVDGALRCIFSTPEEIESRNPLVIRHHILFGKAEYNYIYLEFSSIPPEDFNTSLPIIDNLGKWKFKNINKFHAHAMFMEHHCPDISFALYKVVSREERKTLRKNYRDGRISIIDYMSGVSPFQ